MEETLYECKNKAKQHVYNQKLACVGKSNLINRSITISLASTIFTIGNSEFNSELLWSKKSMPLSNCPTLELSRQANIRTRLKLSLISSVKQGLELKWK